MQPREAHILTMLVDNEFGVLTRITAQIRREGWNIKSIAAQETEDTAVTRITLTLECFDSTLPSVVHRLSRLACVRGVTAFDAEGFLCRELALARVAASEAARKTARRFGAAVAGETEETLLLQLAAEPAVLDAFLDELRAEGDTAYARTGAVTLEKR